MITKEQIKKQIDKLPDTVLDEVYILLKQMSASKDELVDKNDISANWKKWHQNLWNFTPDFMATRQQSPAQTREYFD